MKNKAIYKLYEEQEVLINAYETAKKRGKIVTSKKMFCFFFFVYLFLVSANVRIEFLMFYVMILPLGIVYQIYKQFSLAGKISDISIEISVHKEIDKINLGDIYSGTLNFYIKPG